MRGVEKLSIAYAFDGTGAKNLTEVVTNDPRPLAFQGPIGGCQSWLGGSLRIRIRARPERYRTISDLPQREVQGGYVLADTPGADVILIASGSEVVIALQAHEQLLAEGIRSRVVSMPSWEIFENETQEYRDSVLPPGVKARVAIEQASTFGWERYVGMTGRIIGMHTFGASAPLKALQKKLGFEPSQVVAAAKEQLAIGASSAKAGA